MDFSLQALMASDLSSLLMPATGPSTTPPADGQAPISQFAQLLQNSSEAEPPPSTLSAPSTPPQSALPELMAIVASLAGSSNLLEGVEKPLPSSDTPKEKKPEKESQSPVEINPLAALQALFVGGSAIRPTPVLTPNQPISEDQKAPHISLDVALTAEAPSDTPLEAPAEAPAKQMLNLQDFDVRRFEFKTEIEVATVQPRLIRVSPPLPLILVQGRPHPVQPKPVKGSVETVDSAVAAPSSFGGRHEAPMIRAAEAVHRVQVAIDPPPPPPIARQISMDVGDPESQVRVVIRERSGDLAIQIGAATERLRENLQNAAPLLMHELQRDNTHSTISLDFSRFGTATDGGPASQQESESRRKKAVKSEAVFADVDETAYLTDEAPSAKSF